jgi:hypothetical protein
VAEAPLAGEEADDLGDEERVAVGLLVHRHRQRRRRLHPCDRGYEAGHLRLVQAAQKQPPVVLAAGEVGQDSKQRMSPVHLGVPVAAHHQQPGTLQLPTQEPQQGQRRRIRPVQVVQHQQQRPAGGGRPQEAGQAVEQPEAGRLRLGRRRGRQVRQALADGRHDLGDVGRTGTHVLAQRRRVACLDIGAHDLDPGPEGGRALSLPAAAPQHQDAAGAGLGGQLLGQPGLADAGLAGQQDHPAPAGQGGLQVDGERGQLGLAADERGRHRRPPPSLNRPMSSAPRYRAGRS